MTFFLAGQGGNIQILLIFVAVAEVLLDPLILGLPQGDVCTDSAKTEKEV